MTDDDPVDPGAPTARGEETLADTVAPSKRASLMFKAGETIGKFVVLDTLGRGAMGVVFAAFDPDLDRKVAL